MFHIPSSNLYSRRPIFRRSQDVNPRDRYLAAIVEARSAEAEYLDALAREEQLQRQREEDLLLANATEARLRMQREKAARRQLLVNELYTQELLDDSHTYSELIPAYAHESFADERPNFRHEHPAHRRQRLQSLHRIEEEERARLAFLRREEESLRQQIAQTQSRLTRKVPLFASQSPSEEGRCGHGCKQYSDQAAQTKRTDCCQANKPDNGELAQILRLLVGDEPESRPAPREEQGRQCHSSSGAVSCPRRCIGQKPNQADFPSVSKHSSESTPPVVEAPAKEFDRQVLQDILSKFFGPNIVVKTAQEEETAVPQQTQAASPHPQTNTSATTSTGLSLKEQLENRLQNDPDVEMRDTVQALLASLFTSPSALTTPVTTKSPDTSAVHGKGKAKETSSQSSSSTTSVTIQGIAVALNEIKKVETTFDALQSEFVFPPNLDFDRAHTTNSSHPDGSESLSSSKLVFNSNNAPVRHYEQTLNSLLVQLDAVESYANEEIRRRRKEVVGRVKIALEDLEREVEGRLMAWTRRTSSTTSKREESKETQPLAVIDLAKASTSDSSVVDESTPVVVTAQPSDIPVESTETRVDAVSQESSTSPMHSGPSQDAHVEERTDNTSSAPFSAVSELNLDTSDDPRGDTLQSTQSAQPEKTAQSTDDLTDEKASAPDLSETITPENSSPFPPKSSSPTTQANSLIRSSPLEAENLDTFLLPSNRDAVNEEINGADNGSDDWSEVEA